jgi:hypothetical protein
MKTHEITDPTEQEHSAWIESITETPVRLKVHCKLAEVEWEFATDTDIPLGNDEKMKECIRDHWATLKAAKAHILRRIQKGQIA